MDKGFTMIPKIIHYCWLSDDPIPNELEHYMASWKKKLPDYEFILWNFSRFDKNSSVWVKEAFDNKKYAFAADYIRLYALYTMGGIYLDMDVEVLKSFDDLLDRDYFIGYENSDKAIPEMAIVGVAPECKWIGCALEHYTNRHFVLANGQFDTKTLPMVVKDVLTENGITFRLSSLSDRFDDNVLNILPFDYFSPKSYVDNLIYKTSNTYTIHHFAGSWLPWWQRLEQKIWVFFGLTPHRVLWHVEKWLKTMWHTIKR